jgi:hypothetical protein
VAGRSRPDVLINDVEAELALAETEVAPEELPVDGAEVTLFVATGDAPLDGADDTLPVGAEEMLPDGAEETPLAPVGDAWAPTDEPPAWADERLDNAEESMEADVGSRKSLPRDVGAGSPPVPVRVPVGSPREMSDCESHTDDGMLYGPSDDGAAPDVGQVVVVVEIVGGKDGADVETTVVA